MSIRLDPPAPYAAGPDGQGWNRLSLNAHGAQRAQCALRPRSYAALYESHDTRRARWGGFGECASDAGDCRACPVFAQLRPGERLRSFDPRVLVRLLDRTPADHAGLSYLIGAPPREPHVMNKPAQGWGSSSQRWTWEELARLGGWRLDGQHRDEHGEGFWLAKVNPARYDGMPECDHGWLNRDHCRVCEPRPAAPDRPEPEPEPCGCPAGLVWCRVLPGYHDAQDDAAPRVASLAALVAAHSTA